MKRREQHILLFMQDGWADYMNAFRDTNGDWSQMYFILMQLMCTMIFLNLLIAVLVVNFTVERKRHERPELYTDDDEQASLVSWTETLQSEAKSRRRLANVKRVCFGASTSTPSGCLFRRTPSISSFSRVRHLTC